MILSKTNLLANTREEWTKKDSYANIVHKYSANNY